MYLDDVPTASPSMHRRHDPLTQIVVTDGLAETG